MSQLASAPKTKYAVPVAVIALLLFGILSAYIIKSSSPVNNQAGISSTATEASTSSTGASATSSSTQFKDGTYSAEGDYATPGGTEAIDVTLTVKGGVVTDSSVSQQPADHDSRAYQMEFAKSYKSSVVGRSLSELKLDVVAGSSLTSGGFNEAVDSIRTQASS